ncbi:Microfibrillar-associated protein 1 [Cryptotermes secundus]|nr:Microfibrillar-associated protein 1 [Cryptotermes secundus]
MDESEEEEEEDELSDEEIERRRQMLREKVLNHKEDEEVEVLDKEEEGHSPDESASESSEYEEYSDSEEEAGPRLKPVFVRKKDRVTVMEKEREAVRQKQAEIEAKKMAEERRKYTLKMVEEDIRKETSVKDGDEPSLHDVNTDDENDEVEYEAWKLRELKRIKRDREEREQIERERLEIERLRNMTEEERRQELRNNPKFVTNKATKGKYKFLQKYYHRGAFFMNQDDDLYKRDFSAATLEDHFDKTILPKVMQVKNFGRSGRTKYTHLVDQDTTQFDSPWISETAQNLKFHNNQAAGMKQVFERPSVKRSK